MQSVLAIAIFLLTLTLRILQPNALTIGFSALKGALLTFATSVLSLSLGATVVFVGHYPVITFSLE